MRPDKDRGQEGVIVDNQLHPYQVSCILISNNNTERYVFDVVFNSYGYQLE